MNQEELEALARQQKEVQVDLQRLWRRVQRGRKEHRRSRRLTRLALGGGALVLTSLVVVLGVGGRGPVTDHEAPTGFGLIAAAAAKGERLNLPDGSAIEAHGPATLTLTELRADRVLLHLAEGRVLFRVQPGGPRAWVIDADLARIRVVGTRFWVTRRPEQVEVEVEEGRVSVEGSKVPGGHRLLNPGERLRVLGAEFGAPQGEAPASPATPDSLPAPPAELHPPTRRPKAEGPTHANDPRDPQRLEAGAPAGGARPLAEAQGPSLDDWLAQAEAARRRGDDATAAARWADCLAHFPEAPSMSLVAFRLGRVRLESLGQPALAAAAFEQALALGLPEALEEDAWLRQIQALAESKDLPAARRAKASYLTRFPNSPRRSEADPWVR